MSARERRRKENRRQLGGPRRGRLVAAGGVAAGATLAMSGVAQAAPMTFTVGSLDDTSGATDCATPTNTDCTLRQAIIDSNDNPGADTIVFASSLTGTIVMVADPEPITEALTVQGPGASQLSVDGDSSYRAFYVNLGGSYEPVSISGLTLSNGYTQGNGGAIYNNDANLTISDAVVSDNTAYGSQEGGGVYSYEGTTTIDSSTVTGNVVGGSDLTGRGGGVGSNYGDVEVTNSTISDNTAANYTSDYYNAYGGGVWAEQGDVTVERSTFTGNRSRDGGGVYASSGDLAVVNSTITGNNAVSDDGGGLWASGGLTVTSSTVTDNYAGDQGGGLQSYSGNNTVRNAIVTDNNAPNTPDTADLGRPDEPFDVAFSLVGVPADHVNDTVPDSNLTGIDPQLGPLQNNGGPTDTIEPAATSPVIDCGSDTVNMLDQRGAGFPRVVDQPNRAGSTAAGANAADMGAVEVIANASITGACTNSPPPPPPPPNPTPTPPPSSGSTGQRAAALNRCKRKHKKALKKKRARGALTKPAKKKLNKQFKKCKRKATQLPI